MTAKQWLNRARYTDREISRLIAARNATLDRVLSITPSYAGDVGQGSKDPHKLDKLAELDDAINSLIDTLVDVKREIIVGISRLEDRRLREVLYGRYIEAKTFEQISCDISYSYKQTCRLHGEALKEMEAIINDRKRGA